MIASVARDTTDGRIEYEWDARAEELLFEYLGAKVAAWFADEDVTDILIRRDWISIDRISRGLERRDDARGTVQLIAALRHLAPYAGVELSPMNPRVEVSLRMPYHPRISGLYAGPGGMDSFLTIRLHRARKMNLAQAAAAGMCLDSHVELLREVLRVPTLGVLVSGPTSSGKTTFLRIIGQEIIELHGEEEHLVVVEDGAELYLDGPHVTPIEATQYYSYRDALKTALRQRPSRLIVGEGRGAEVYDAVKGGANGHGLLMSIHSDTAAGAIRVLLARMREGSESGHVDEDLIRQAVHLVVVMRRDARGRHVSEIAHLVPDAGPLKTRLVA